MTPDVIERLLTIFESDESGDPARSYLTILAAGVNDCCTTAGRTKTTRPQQPSQTAKAAAEAQKLNIILAMRRAENAISEL